jgi:hypothetical protein
VISDRHVWRSANAVSQGEEPDAVAATVESIMAERGVSKRRAYFLLREQQQEKMTETPVSESQRTRMLAVLYRANGSIRNSTELTEALHKAGYETSGHDTVKVLWSLQKTGHVLFRERQSPRMLYAIKLTTLGKIDGKRFAEPQPQVTMVVEEPDPFVISPVGTIKGDEVVWPEPVPVEELADQDHPDLVEEDQVVEHFAEATGVPLYTKPWTLDMEGFPAMRALRDRARKAVKLAEAAKLLEEAGEDEMALNLMSKTDFNPLEEEVIELLRRFEEI